MITCCLPTPVPRLIRGCLSGTSPRRTSALHCITFSTVLLLTACSEPDPLISKADWTFVNYWAEWCRPCIKEVPELNSLNGRAGYRVLGVNFDGETGAELAAQVEKLGVAFPTLETDPAERLALERPVVLPTTLILAPGGDLHGVLVGPQTVDTLIAATEAPSSEP